MTGDVERGEQVVRRVLWRTAYFCVLFAALPALLGSGTITPIRVMRVVIVLGICWAVYRRVRPWMKWLLLPTVVGALAGAVGGMARFGFNAWVLFFATAIAVYFYNVLRLWIDDDAKAYLALPPSSPRA